MTEKQHTCALGAPYGMYSTIPANCPACQYPDYKAKFDRAALAERLLVACERASGELVNLEVSGTGWWLDFATGIGNQTTRIEVDERDLARGIIAAVELWVQS